MGVAVLDFNFALSRKFLDSCLCRIRNPKDILGFSGDVNAIHEEGGELFRFDFTMTECENLIQTIALFFDVVHYDLENWKDILASKCRLFTDIDTSYVSIGRIVRSGGIQACLDFYESIGKEAAEELKSMLVFDAVIYNEDRHFGNFGILRDNHTGKILGPAPIFDNGLSLFNYAMPDDIQNLEEYARTRANPYGVSYEAICREVMGTKQRNQLRRLIGFRFTRHPSINLPEERLTAIEKQIDLRVRELLALPRAKKEKA